MTSTNSFSNTKDQSRSALKPNNGPLNEQPKRSLQYQSQSFYAKSNLASNDYDHVDRNKDIEPKDQLQLSRNQKKKQTRKKKKEQEKQQEIQEEQKQKIAKLQQNAEEFFPKLEGQQQQQQLEPNSTQTTETQTKAKEYIIKRNPKKEQNVDAESNWITIEKKSSRKKGTKNNQKDEESNSSEDEEYQEERKLNEGNNKMAGGKKSNIRIQKPKAIQNQFSIKKIAKKKKKQGEDEEAGDGQKVLQGLQTVPLKTKIWPSVQIYRVRDIISKYNKEKRRNQEMDKDKETLKKILKSMKKKKQSKLKRAKQSYFEHINDKNDKKPKKGPKDDDGFETEEEDDNDETKAQKAATLKLAPKKQESSSVIQDDEEKQEPQEPEIIDILEYPELKEIAPIKKPQIIYNQIQIREWVDHVLSAEIDELVLNLINRLVHMQTVKKLNQPSKFKKRIVNGMREVERSIQSGLQEKQCKLLVLALNIQKIPVKDGTDDKIANIIKEAKQRNIPIVHSCTRKLLGQVCTGNLSTKVSAVSIINYFGADDIFKQLLQLVEQKRLEFFSKNPVPEMNQQNEQLGEQ